MVSVNYIVLGAALLLTAIGIIGMFGFRKSSDNNKPEDTKYLREIFSRDQKIHNLQTKIDNLNKLNDRYLSFMIKIPSIIQRLNSTLHIDEIAQAIVQLTSDIIPAKNVEFYCLDRATNMLTITYSINQENTRQVSYAVGEGLIGMAAQQRMIKMKGQVRKMSAFDSHLWMAVPITFKDRLFGVVGIGQAEELFGSESDVMRMVADIAGSALMNQTMLGEAKEKANTDSLTGLNNRYYLLQMAQKFMERAVRECIPISVLFFDIDNFKHYNDTNGHDEGDKLLKKLSDLINSLTLKDSVIARYGGEEFIVMLLGISKEDSFIYAEKLREKIAGYPFINREKQPLGCISISGGIAGFPTDGDAIPKVIQLADTALYQAKSEGRNRILMYKSMYLSDAVFAYNGHPADKSLPHYET
jgi:diguanylate cyclase (GGDEF)-like protein